MLTNLNYMLLQKEAKVRVANQADIFAAAKLGKCNLIVDHVLSNPACVHQRDSRYSV